MNPWARRGLLIVAPIVGWIGLASWAYCLSNGLDYSFWAWPHGLKWWGANLWVSFILLTSAALPTMLLFSYCVMMFNISRRGRLRRRAKRYTEQAMIPIERGSSDNFGHARFADATDMSIKFHGPGLLIGAFDRGKQENFIYDDPGEGPGHAISVAGPGSHKSTTAVTRLLKYFGPRVVFDPSCEIGPIMNGYAPGHPKHDATAPQPLTENGYDVYTVDLNGNGIDILEWVDVKDPEADPHIRTVVSWIHNSGTIPATQQKDPFWSLWGKALLTCLLAHLLYSDCKNKTLEYFYQGISTPENLMIDLLTGIYHTSNSRMARYIAGQLMGSRAPQTFSGIYANAVGAVDWLGTDVYARAVSRNGFDTTAILDPNSVVFISIPLRTMLTTPTIGRAIMGALFNVLFHADGDNIQERVLFEIDEAWLLGASEEIKLCHVAGRKYKACVHTIWPSESLMESIWTAEGANVLRDTSSWRSYNAIQDGNTAERLSKDLGEYSVIAYNEGDNFGTQQPRGFMSGWGSQSNGTNISRHEIVRRLRKREEILRAPADTTWVLRRDFPYPIECCTAPYFRYPAIEKEVNPSRFSLDFNRGSTEREYSAWLNKTISGAPRLTPVKRLARPLSPS